ncbi:MAG: hypothetical protein HC915_01560 [Anaerolineae bacterium]|nr:hypothetical protein [Anaerolineae bacterium]
MYPVNFRNPVDLNRYGYAAGNPVNAWDPSGLFMESSLVRSVTGAVSQALRLFARDPEKNFGLLVGLIGGGFAGLTGYWLGVMGYNLIIKQKAFANRLEGFEWADAIKSMAIGVVTGGLTAILTSRMNIKGFLGFFSAASPIASIGLVLENLTSGRLFDDASEDEVRPLLELLMDNAVLMTSMAVASAANNFSPSFKRIMVIVGIAIDAFLAAIDTMFSKTIDNPN